MLKSRYLLISALTYCTTRWRLSYKKNNSVMPPCFVLCIAAIFATSDSCTSASFVADRLLLCILQVKADKLREVKNGHDGTWVAHPALVTLALEIFNEHMPQPNQIDKKREDVHVTRENLLEVSYCL